MAIDRELYDRVKSVLEANPEYSPKDAIRSLGITDIRKAYRRFVYLSYKVRQGNLQTKPSPNTGVTFHDMTLAEKRKIYKQRYFAKKSALTPPVTTKSGKCVVIVTELENLSSVLSGLV